MPVRYRVRYMTEGPSSVRMVPKAPHLDVVDDLLHGRVSVLSNPRPLTLMLWMSCWVGVSMGALESMTVWMAPAQRDASVSSLV